MALSPELLLDHAASVSSLGAAVYRLAEQRRAAEGANYEHTEAEARSAAEEEGDGKTTPGGAVGTSEGQEGPGAAGDDEDEAPLLLSDAAGLLRAGDLAAAEAACLRAAPLLGVPSDVAWWEQAPLTSTHATAANGSAACANGAAYGGPPAPVARLAAAPLLALLAAVWRRHERPRAAAVALAALLRLRMERDGGGEGNAAAASAEEVVATAAARSLDTALLHVQLARLQLELGEEGAATASVAAADAAAAQPSRADGADASRVGELTTSPHTTSPHTTSQPHNSTTSQTTSTKLFHSLSLSGAGGAGCAPVLLTPEWCACSARLQVRGFSLRVISAPPARLDLAAGARAAAARPCLTP